MSPWQRTLTATTAVLVLAGALGAFAWWGVKLKDDTAGALQASHERLFANASAEDATAVPDFTALTVEAKGELTVLERAPDGAWRLTRPVSARADKAVLETLTTELQTGRFKTRVTEKPSAEDLTRYGLRPPQFKVTAVGTLRGAVKTVVFEGGLENTFDGSVFMQRAGEEAVYAVNGNVRFSLERTTFDLRDKELFHLDRQALTQIDFQSGAHRYTLLRDAKDKRWSFTAPRAMRAENDAVNRMLDALAGFRAKAFVEARPALQTPAEEVTFTDSKGVTTHFALVNDGDRAYVRRDNLQGSEIAEVPMAVLSVLDQPVSELEDTALLPFKPESVAKIVFSPDGLTLERDGDAWQVTTPEHGRAKHFKMTALLWTLGALKAKSVSKAKFEPVRGLTVFGPAGKELARVQIGKPVPGDEDRVYAKDSKSRVVEVEAARIGELPRSARELLEPAADSGIR